jgi:peptide/nickel transport system permease protein
MSATETALADAPSPPARPWSLVALLCLGWLALVVAAAALAPVLAPHDYAAQFPLSRLLPPVPLQGSDPAFLLGTDHLGRCILSRTLHAIRFSLLVALIGTAIGAVLGTVLGLIAAQQRGWVEDAIMALVDVFASIPFIILALCVIAFFGADFVVFLIVVGLAGWERYARLARALVLDAATSGYAEAARNLGVPPLAVLRRHYAPNIAAPLLVQVTINFPDTILLETGLSFLGLGVQPPLTSLGLMVSEAKDLLPLTAWPAIPPAIAIFLTTLAVSLLGDHLRDRTDSALRQG